MLYFNLTMLRQASISYWLVSSSGVTDKEDGPSCNQPSCHRFGAAHIHSLEK